MDIRKENKKIIRRVVWHQEDMLGEAVESSSLEFSKTGPDKAAAD